MREHYEEVVLYTDTNGYRVFGELLKLPYTDIVVQYDNLPCPEQHWAYPKLLTYSLQEKPFLHVDGDVFLPYRLPQEIESAGLAPKDILKCVNIIIKYDSGKAYYEPSFDLNYSINEMLTFFVLHEPKWYEYEIETYKAEMQNDLNKSAHYKCEKRWLIWQYEALLSVAKRCEKNKEKL